MRTTLDIDDDVLSAVRAIAADRDISMGSALSEIARAGLAKRSLVSDGGLPVFDVPADAPILTPEMVRRALEDE